MILACPLKYLRQTMIKPNNNHINTGGSTMLLRVQRSPITSSLFEPLFNFDRDIDGLFESVWRAPTAHSTYQYPALDIAEYENESVVVAEMPGVKKDLKLTVHDGVLTISGERKVHQMPERSSWLRNEIRTGEFTRAIRLPHDVKADTISAELANGVLRIVLPKADELRPREIAIK
jgi:HSP20 family protein